MAVIGGGDADLECIAMATEVGRLLAVSGAIVLTGGRGGVMDAACRGASDAGGVSIGILPGESRQEANRFATFTIPTGLGQARNVIIAIAADAVIAVGGAYGTLSEIAHALRFERPVIGLRTWNLTPGTGVRQHIVTVHTPAEAVRVALDLLTRDNGG